MGRLSGQIVVVTGGASELGEGIVRRLAQEDAALVIADINEVKAVKLAESLRDQGMRALGVGVDVAHRDQMRAMVVSVANRSGGIDVLFNNAGFKKPVPFMDVDKNNFDGIMSVNAFLVLVGVQEVGRHMKQRG